MSSSIRRVHSSPEVIVSVANLVEVRKNEADVGTYFEGSGADEDFCGGDGLFCSKNFGPESHSEACSWATVFCLVPISAGLEDVSIFSHCEAVDRMRRELILFAI